MRDIKQKERATTRVVVAVGHVTKDAEEELVGAQPDAHNTRHHRLRALLYLARWGRQCAMFFEVSFHHSNSQLFLVV